MPQEERTKGLSYIEELIQQMQENEQNMKRLLHSANLMTQSVDWQVIRKKVFTQNADKEVFTDLVHNLVDVYSGIIANCSMFAAGCSLTAEFLSAANLSSNADPTSLDWILQSANNSSPCLEQEEELNRLLLSFEGMSLESSETLKSSILLAIGL